MAILLNYFFKAALARLEALENDNAGIENVEINDDDDEDSLDDDDEGFLTCIAIFLQLTNLCMQFSRILILLYRLCTKEAVQGY